MPPPSNLEDAVAAVLRPLETATFIIQTSAPYSAQSPAPLPNTIRDTRRVLAIVTHEEDAGHGGLFIFKWKRSQPPALLLVGTLPLSSDLEVQASQLSNVQIPQDDPQGESSRSTFLVHLKSDGQELSFICDDAHNLSGFLTECKRLRAIQAATTEDDAPERSHSWLSAYSQEVQHRHLLHELEREQDMRNLLRGPNLSEAAAGLPGDEALDTILIRDDWFRKTIDSRVSEYSSTRDIRIRVGNFNVNGRPPTESLATWVCKQVVPGEKDVESEDPDILIFGFQEVDLSTGALLYSTSTALEDAWTEGILLGLGNRAKSYVKFTSKQLVGMLIIGFIRKGQHPYVSEISTSSLGIGILGLMGNKGAVGLRFKFRDTTLCFVASHLAAFDNQMEKRNADYLEITRRLQFPIVSPHAPAAQDDLQVVSVSASVFDSDILIWLGDLNYRLDLPDDEVRTLLGTKLLPFNRDALMKYDQLKTSIKQGKCFNLFDEGLIEFLPTYRFKVGLSGDEEYDWKRRPAWTDRILWAHAPFQRIRQVSYTSHPEISMSDHKPISSEFIVEAISIDKDNYGNITGELIKSLNGLDQAGKVNSVVLNEKSIDFEEVRYMVKIVKQFSVTNSGTTPCAYRFVPTDLEKPIVPSWLSIDKEYGIILPQATIEFQLTTLIDDSLAGELNQTDGTLEATLILHIEHGLDYFVAVSGTFMPTCFARTLRSLTSLPGSVRESAGKPLLPENKALSAPRELLRILDWLMTHTVIDNPDELFFSQSHPELLALIREGLDTGAEFSFDTSPRSPPTSPLRGKFAFFKKGSETAPTPSISERQITLAFAEVLVDFLRSLQEPVVPVDLYPLVLATTSTNDTFEFLDALPHSSTNVWVSLTAYLQYVCSQTTGDQGERTDAIASIFSDVLIPDQDEGVQLTPLQKRSFLMLFLA